MRKDNYTLFKVRLGEWDTRTNPDCEHFVDEKVCSDGHKDVAIEQSIPHPEYKRSSFKKLHDIALIRLAEEILFTKFIKPICLPSLNERKINLTYVDLFVAGENFSFVFDFYFLISFKVGEELKIPLKVI